MHKNVDNKFKNNFNNNFDSIIIFIFPSLIILIFFFFYLLHTHLYPLHNIMLINIVREEELTSFEIFAFVTNKIKLKSKVTFARRKTWPQLFVMYTHSASQTHVVLKNPPYEAVSVLGSSRDTISAPLGYRH